jgi:hypothetical protein
MSESKRISWRMLTGNRYLQGVLPEMFSNHGCIKQQRIRKTGDLVPSVFEVKYDRDYGVEFLSKKICKRLHVLGREQVHALIDEAWDLTEQTISQL